MATDSPVVRSTHWMALASLLYLPGWGGSRIARVLVLRLIVRHTCMQGPEVQYLDEHLGLASLLYLPAGCILGSALVCLLLLCGTHAGPWSTWMSLTPSSRPSRQHLMLLRHRELRHRELLCCPALQPTSARQGEEAGRPAAPSSSSRWGSMPVAAWGQPGHVRGSNATGRTPSARRFFTCIFTCTFCVCAHLDERTRPVTLEPCHLGFTCVPLSRNASHSCVLAPPTLCHTYLRRCTWRRGMTLVHWSRSGASPSAQTWPAACSRWVGQPEEPRMPARGGLGLGLGLGLGPWALRGVQFNNHLRSPPIFV